MNLEQVKELEEIQTTIRMRFPDIAFPEPVLEPMYFGRLNKTLVDDRKLVLDKNTGKQFDIVSDQYNLLHHEKIIHTLIEACPEENLEHQILKLSSMLTAHDLS